MLFGANIKIAPIIICQIFDSSVQIKLYGMVIEWWLLDMYDVDIDFEFSVPVGFDSNQIVLNWDEAGR